MAYRSRAGWVLPSSRIAHAVACAVFLLACADARAQDRVELGRQYLLSTRATSGAFAGTPIVDSVEAVEALPPGVARDEALFAIGQLQPDNREAEVARAFALAKDPFYAALPLEVVRSTGAWQHLGLTPESLGRDPLVLAWALRLAARTGDVAAAEGLFGVALAIQRADGGFGFADNESDLAVTADVIRAIGAWPSGDLRAMIFARGRAFLVARRGEWSALPDTDVGALTLALRDSDAVLAAELAEVLAFRQGLDGSFDGGDVRATALCVQALSSVLPDLQLTPPLVVADAVTGSDYAIRFPVTNRGATSSSPTALAVSVADEAGTVRTFTFPVPVLAPGAVTTVSAALGPQGAPGPYAVTAILNPDATFPEVTFENNHSALRYTVTGLPDLAVAEADLHLQSPPALHQACDVVVTVRNVGAGAAREVHAQLFLGEPGAGGRLIGETSFSSVFPGGQRLLLGRFTPESLDPVRLVVRIDPADTVRESREDNNAASRSADVRTPAEMTINAWPYLHALATVKKGADLDVAWGPGFTAWRGGVIHWEPGLWPWRPVSAALYEGQPGSGRLVERREFPPNYYTQGTATTTFSTNELLPGVHHFHVVIDPDLALSETDELDNVKQVSVTVTADDLPELWPESVAFEPPLLRPGEPFTVIARIRNTGLQPASNVPVRFQIGASTSAARDVIVPELAVDGVYELREQFTARTTAGNYGATVRVDPSMIIAQNTRTNDYLQTTVRVLGADLRVVSAGLVPAAPAVDEPAVLRVELENIGIRSGTQVHMRVLWTSSGAGAQEVGEQTFTRHPAPGESMTFDVPVDISHMSGDETLRLLLQSTAVILDLTVHVRNPDFVVSAAGIGTDPEVVEVGAPLTPHVLVSNLGEADAATSVRIYRGYPEQGDLVDSGTVLVPAGGTAVYSGATFDAPTSAPYVISVVLNEEGAVVESSTANNVASRVVTKREGAAVVAFDETHFPGLTVSINEAPWPSFTGSYAEFARDLEERGYVVKTINPSPDGLTAARLEGVDVLVVALPVDAYEPGALAVLDAFLANGNGLLYVGDWGHPSSAPEWQAQEDAFLSFLGATNGYAKVGTPGVMCSGDLPSVATRPHPITAGVSKLHGNVMGGFASIPAGGAVLAGTTGTQQPSGLIVAGAFDVRGGRAVVVGDTQVFDSAQLSSIACGEFVIYPSNRRFAMQVVDWLVNGKPSSYLADLAFVPESLLLDDESPIAGAPVLATFTVKNTGGAPSDATRVHLYEGEPGAESLVGSFELEPLSSEESVELSFTWDTAHRAGPRRLVARVDEENEIPELNEANNSIEQAIEVRPGTDLRVDPSDVVAVGGAAPALQITVRNVGFTTVPPGTWLRARDAGSASPVPLAEVQLGPVPARGKLSITVPWPNLDPTVAHRLEVTADARGDIDDPFRPDNTAALTLAPPTVSIAAPASGTVWGGTKTLRWAGSSTENPSPTYDVAMAPEGQPFTGLAVTSSSSLALDTTRYPDGNYVLRVAASDGLLTATRDVRFRIANAGQAVRTWGASPGTPTARLDVGAAAADVRIPVGFAVSSATLLVEPLPAVVRVQPEPFAGSTAFLARHGPALAIVARTQPSGWRCGVWSSRDDGSRWSAWSSLSTTGTSDNQCLLLENRQGLHAIYAEANDDIFLRSSLDGETWSPPRLLARGVVLSTQGNDEGLVLVLRVQTQRQVLVGTPDGESWRTLETDEVVRSAVHATALMSGGALRVFLSRGSKLEYYAARPDAALTAASMSGPVVLDSGNIATLQPLALGSGLFIGYRAGTEFRVQRCLAGRDCLRDGWLQEPRVLGTASSAMLGGDDATGPQLLWNNAAVYRAKGLEGGARWARTYESPLFACGQTSLVFTSGSAACAERRSTGLFYDREPGITPAELLVGIADRAPFHATPGNSASPEQVDVTAELAAWLESASDADDGVVDGYLTVPFRATSAGAGQTALANLEIRLTPSSELDGYAAPLVFSPSASPGVLDATAISMRWSGDVAVTNAAGQAVRALSPVPVGARYLAQWNGRAEDGNVLPPGRYGFGPPGLVVGHVEIDDVPPTAILDVEPATALGGLVEIRGLATDEDYAGTAKNFTRFELEYSLDGATFAPIARSSHPASGVLATWNTQGLRAPAASLRLTVHDRAGNSAVATRGIQLSPDAPPAPVILAPTVAGTPRDVVGSTVTVAGTAPAGVDVLVFVGSRLAGVVPSDGAWELGDVVLPDGITEITAQARRGDLAGPRSMPITVARYALDLTVSAPMEAEAGEDVAVGVRIQRTSVSAGPLTVRLVAVDALGVAAPIGFLPEELRAELPASGSWNGSAALVTRYTPAGLYYLRAEVVSGGLLPASAESPLTLGSTVSVFARLASDRAVYDGLQSPVLSATLENLGFTSSGPLIAHFTLTLPDGTLRPAGEATFADIAPQDFDGRSVVIGTAPLDAGSYLAHLDVTDALGNVVAQAVTDFAVEVAGGTDSISGTVVALPVEYRIGEFLTAEYSITNHAGLSDIPVRVLLVEEPTGSVVAIHETTLVLQPGATEHGSARLSTAAASGGDLLVMLVGRGRGLASQLVTPSPWRDTEPPVILISGVEEGELRSGTITPIIEIRDESAFTSSALLSGALFESGTTISQDGEYLLVVEATDAFGNTAVVPWPFAIDTIPPSIMVTGVEPGGVYLGPVTPSFSALDPHLEATRATLDGASFSSGTPVASNGTHTLYVEARDRAGNAADETVSFSTYLVDASLRLSLDQRPRVLIKIDCSCHQEACADERAALLTNSLQAAGIQFEFAESSEAFLQKFRSRRHNVWVLYRNASAECHAYDELREATWSGGGLVVVNDAAPDNNPKLKDALGVQTQGKIDLVGSVDLRSGPLGSARSFPVFGKGAQQKLVSASAQGTTPGGKVIVSTNVFGTGRAVTITLDPEQTPSPEMSDLLIRSVTWASGGQRAISVPGEPMTVLIDAQANMPGLSSFWLTAAPSPGLEVLEAPLASVLEPLSWLLALPPGQGTSRTLTVVSNAEGDQRIDAVLAARVPDTSFQVAAAGLELSWPHAPSELKQRALDAVQSHPACSRGGTLSHIAGIDPQPGNAQAAEAAIRDAIHALEKLGAAGEACVAARSAVSDLLRSLEIQSTQLR